MMTTRRGLVFLAAAGLFASACGLSTARAEGAIPDGSIIVLVRHANKEGDGSGDCVPLSDKGVIRALALRDKLQGMGIAAIVTTSAVRTRDTAQPLSELLDIAVIPIKRNKEKEVEIAEMEKKVRSKLPGQVLVVAHSETVPGLIEALGGPANQQIHGYDDLFILTGVNGETEVERQHYGEPD